MSKELPPSRTAEQFVVRFPAGMRDRIAGVAKVSGRSMNAEIISRLEASFTAQPAGSGNTAGVLGAMTTMLAKMLVRTAQLLTPEQKKRNPAVDVWEAVAEGVVDGRGAVIAEVISGLGPDFDSPAHTAPKNKVLSSPGIIRQTLKDLESVTRLERGNPQTVELAANKGPVKRARGKPPK